MPDERRRFEQSRCGVCGKVHPLIKVCPFVQSQVVRYEPVGEGRRRVVARVVETVYFPRPELIADALDTYEEAAEILKLENAG